MTVRARDHPSRRGGSRATACRAAGRSWPRPASRRPRRSRSFTEDMRARGLTAGSHPAPAGRRRRRRHRRARAWRSSPAAGVVRMRPRAHGRRRAARHRGGLPPGCRASPGWSPPTWRARSLFERARGALRRRASAFADQRVVAVAIVGRGRRAARRRARPRRACASTRSCATPASCRSPTPGRCSAATAMRSGCGRCARRPADAAAYRAISPCGSSTNFLAAPESKSL